MTKTIRGQKGTCEGTLRITLSGPQGVGKSLVLKVLEAILPLLPLDVVVVTERNTK